VRPSCLATASCPGRRPAISGIRRSGRIDRPRATVERGLPEASQRRTRLHHDGVRRLAERYATAWETGDVEAIVGMLREDGKYAMPSETERYQGHHIPAFIIQGR
jgi:hypothetical protein